MTRFPRVSGKEILAALLRDGYYLSHVRGSHHYLRKSNMPGLVVVPVHGKKVLPPGTLQAILRQASLAVGEFKDLL